MRGVTGGDKPSRRSSRFRNVNCSSAPSPITDLLDADLLAEGKSPPFLLSFAFFLDLLMAWFFDLLKLENDPKLAFSCAIPACHPKSIVFN